MFCTFAGRFSATDTWHPPLVRSAWLAQIGYLTNFPHLGMFASIVSDPDEAAAADVGADIPSSLLAPAGFGLQSAVCYNVYDAAAGSELRSLEAVSVLGHCFRNERWYEGLRRTRVFTMREVVFMGPATAVQAVLNEGRQAMSRLAASVGLPASQQQATDPFFRPDGARTYTQRLFSLKIELTVDGLAIASANYHRSFFGERAGIRTTDGSVAHTACVGFGLERWLAVLLDAHRGDPDKVNAVLDEALAAWDALPRA